MRINQRGARRGNGTETAAYLCMSQASQRRALSRAGAPRADSKRATVHVMPLPAPAEDEDDLYDTQELASQAAHCLEAYRRAPWRSLNERTRLAKLRRAIDLLQRIEDLETGRIPIPMWGD